MKYKQSYVIINKNFKVIILKKEDEWNEIRDDIDSKNEEIIEKYGFDIRKKFADSINEENILKRKRKIFVFKIVCIILCVILLSSLTHYICVGFKCSKIKRDLTDFTVDGLDYVSNNTNLFGDGYFIFTSPDIGNSVIHIFKNKDIYINDMSARYYKYYFEKWDDKDKHLFNVIETYSDCKLGLRKKEDWILHFDTYIYANTEEEVIYATEAIIRFVNFMNKPNIIPNCFIQVGNRKILPKNSSGQSNDQIRAMALTLYRSDISY